MIVAGLDLSLTGTGIALVDTLNPGKPILFTERSFTPARLPTPGRKPSQRGPKDKGIVPPWLRADRIKILTDRIISHLEKLPLELVVIEGPSHSSQHGLPHERGGLWWAVAIRALDLAPIAEVAPSSRAKYATGDGRATKDEVKEQAIPRYQLPSRDHNQVDAMVLAAMGCRHLQAPIESTPLPDAYLAAMRGVLWPPLKGNPCLI